MRSDHQRGNLKGYLEGKMKNVLVLTTLVAVSLIDSVASFFPPFQLNAVNSPRFVGGNPAQIGDFPWIISIQYEHETGWKHDCGGAIIDSKHIITAGHCVWSRNASEIEVVAGIYKITKTEITQQRRSPEKIFLHPNYTSGDGPGAFDVAIIRLKKPFRFNKSVKKIDLAKCKEIPQKGEQCMYAGWGNLFPVSPFYYQGSDVLMTEPTTIVSSEECVEAYSMYPEALATAVCSRSGVFHGTCQGDSGGPLTCYRDNLKTKPYLAGVVSFGFPVCNDGYHPDVYTNLGSLQICNFYREYEKQAAHMKTKKS